MAETVGDVLEKISKRNPGRLDVCFRLMEYLGELAFFDFAVLESVNVLGSDLYVLFAECCKRDIAQVHAAIQRGTAIEQLATIPGTSFWKRPDTDSTASQAV